MRAYRTAGEARYLAKGCSKCSASRRQPPSLLSSTSPVGFVHNTWPPSGPTQRFAMPSSTSATRKAAVTDPWDAMDTEPRETVDRKSGPWEGGNGRGREKGGSAVARRVWFGLRDARRRSPRPCRRWGGARQPWAETRVILGCLSLPGSRPAGVPGYCTARSLREGLG